MRDLGVDVVHIRSFVIDNGMDKMIRTRPNCYILNTLGFGHTVSSVAMEYLHGRLEALCRSGNTTKTC